MIENFSYPAWKFMNALVRGMTPEQGEFLERRMEIERS